MNLGDRVPVMHLGGSRRYRLKSAALLTAALALLGTACSSSGNPTSVPSTVPTLTLPPSPSAVISSALDSATTTFCQHVDDLKQQVAALQASPTPDLSSVSSALSTAGQNLRADATQLQNAGHSDLASIATALSATVDTLQGLLTTQSSIPAGADAAIGAISAGLASLPQNVCPSS